MDFESMNVLCLLGQMEQSVPQTYLHWAFQSLGLFYGLAIPAVGLLVFLGAWVVVLVSRRPAVIASYLVFVPLPFLIGVLGSLQGALSSLMVIATAQATPRPSDIAAGVSMALFTSLAGLLAMLPSYLVVAIGLFTRSVLSGKTPPK